MGERLKSISSVLFISALTLISSPFLLFADSVDSWIPQIGPQSEKTVEEVVVAVINWGIGFAAVVAVVMIVVAGIMYITANGDEQKIGKATKTLTFAIIGLVVCFIAIMLINFVIVNFLGLSGVGGGAGGDRRPFDGSDY